MADARAIGQRLKVLFFDVFGTCVAQRIPVTAELQNAAKEALESNISSIRPEVRQKAASMTYDQWREVMEDWNREEGKFIRENIAKTDTVPWHLVDEHRLKTLHTLLAQRGLIIMNDTVNDSVSSTTVSEGSLWSESQIKHLSLVWHRLPPWPDTCPGLNLFNRHVPTVSLSNTHSSIIAELVKNGKIPFSKVWSADMFQSYKPNAKVYLGAAERMSVEPEECGLIATHLYDLEAAKANGFYAIYVERVAEESHPELLGKGIPDMWIKPEDNGFVTVAEHLGWS